MVWFASSEMHEKSSFFNFVNDRSLCAVVKKQKVTVPPEHHQLPWRIGSIPLLRKTEEEKLICEEKHTGSINDGGSVAPVDGMNKRTTGFRFLFFSEAVWCRNKTIKTGFCGFWKTGVMKTGFHDFLGFFVLFWAKIWKTAFCSFKMFWFLPKVTQTGLYRTGT